MSEEILESQKRPNKPANFSESQTLAGRRDSIAQQFPDDGNYYLKKNLEIAEDRAREGEEEESPKPKLFLDDPNQQNQDLEILRHSALYYN